MEKKNYYEILGVTVDAPQQTIQQAYRAKAMVSHPDRGGSHEAMLAINEAYEILINPETRRHYDEARANQHNQAAQHQAQADTSQAKQQADQYPREWTDFETWLKRDFTDAAYYQNERGQLRVDNSHSGIVFMVIGFVAGIAVFVIMGMATGRLIGGPLVWLLGGAGAGVGAWLHKQIGDSMHKPGQHSPRPDPASASPDQRVIVSCPKCGQKLRVPDHGARVRCPACQFEFNGTAPKSPPASDQETAQQPVRETQKEQAHENRVEHNPDDDLTEQIRQYRQAAEQGDAEAQFQFALCLENGEGVAKNEVEAVRWYRRAAELNHAIAQNNLGCHYAKGQGVEKDLTEAVRWCRKSAEQSFPQAQYNLGWGYAQGEGVEKDFVKASQWYRKAAEQDHSKAQTELGDYYFDGLGVLQDCSEAIKWYAKAAEGGIVQAQFKLGFIFANGGEPADTKSAVRVMVDSKKTEKKVLWGLIDGFKEGFEEEFNKGKVNRLKNALGKNRCPLVGVKTDLIAAYKWMSIAAVQRHEDSVEMTDYLATLMTEEEVAEGKRQARVILESQQNL